MERARYVKTVDRDPRGVREHTVGPEMEKVATPWSVSSQKC